ncbi:MAG TPA: transcription elongation factor GreA [Chloroflexi bacterium]|nr:transcription elongation factor GreA [Chloroflexota bacterium]
MNKEQTFLTAKGYHTLKEELDHLRTVRRQQVARRLHEALEEGDILENAELEDARNEQAFVEGRILTLERMLRSAVIIEETGPRDTIGLGSRVTVLEVEGDESPETYHIVGSAEADPIRGLISNESPLGRALMGRKVGEIASVNAPDGVLMFQVVGIQ